MKTPVVIFFVMFALCAPAVEQWGMFEVSLTGPTGGNPYRDVQWSATFSQGDRHVSVPGFWDGGDTYKVRFSPPTTGGWRYETRSATPELKGKTGVFTVTAPTANNHGPVEIFDTFYLRYADGRLRLAVNQWPDSIQNDSSPAKLQVGKWTFFAVTYDATRSRDSVSWYFSPAMDAPGQTTIALDRTTSYNVGPVDPDIGPLAIGNFNETQRRFELFSWKTWRGGTQRGIKSPKRPILRVFRCSRVRRTLKSSRDPTGCVERANQWSEYLEVFYLQKLGGRA